MKRKHVLITLIAITGICILAVACWAVWLKAKTEKEIKSELTGELSHFYYPYLEQRKELSGYLSDLEDKIRQDPGNYDLSIRYLSARRHIRGEKPSIEWLGDIAEPAYALDALLLASRMREEQPESAIRLYELSLALPVTDYDRTLYRKRDISSIYLAPDEIKTWLRKRAKRGLAAACLFAGKLDRAQNLIEELTVNIDETLKDLFLLFLAGEIEAASGQRVVEGRIKKVEKQLKDSEQYRLARELYYKGRKENDVTRADLAK